MMRPEQPDPREEDAIPVAYACAFCMRVSLLAQLWRLETHARPTPVCPICFTDSGIWLHATDEDDDGKTPLERAHGCSQWSSERLADYRNQQYTYEGAVAPPPLLEDADLRVHCGQGVCSVTAAAAAAGGPRGDRLLLTTYYAAHLVDQNGQAPLAGGPSIYNGI